MKYLIIIGLLGVSLYFGNAYLDERKITRIEKSLFPEIRKVKVNGPVECDPAFITYRKKDLFIYCHPVKNNQDKHLIEHLRKEVVKAAKLWAETSEENPKYFQVRFTNEIILPSTK